MCRLVKLNNHCVLFNVNDSSALLLSRSILIACKTRLSTQKENVDTRDSVTSANLFVLCERRQNCRITTRVLSSCKNTSPITGMTTWISNCNKLFVVSLQGGWTQSVGLEILTACCIMKTRSSKQCPSIHDSQNQSVNFSLEVDIFTH